MASLVGCSSGSNRASTLLLVDGRWIPGSGRGVELGKFAGVGVDVARPRCGAWPRLRAAPFMVFVTLISCALHVVHKFKLESLILVSLIFVGIFVSNR